MKRLLLIALALFLLLSACSPDDAGGDAENPDNQQTQQGGQTSSPDSQNDGDVVALRIGGIEITSNEYRYQYYTIVQYFTSFYSSVTGIDEEVPLEEQYYDESTGLTWADFFAEQTIDGVRNTVLLSEQAKQMGMTLDEIYKIKVTKQIDELKSVCESNGDTLEEVLKRYYGGSMNEDSLREIMERTYLGYQFQLYKKASVDVSDMVLQDYYNLHAGDFDAVDYIGYMFETAEDANKCLAAITDEASFYKYIADNFGENLDDYLSIGENNGEDEMSDWLFDDARKEGDAAVVEAYGVYMVMYFYRRYQPDDESLNIRHLLISNETHTAEEAHAEAQKLYDEWKKGAATEESFAEMAAKYSEDAETAQYGGLFENVYEGQMPEEFENWCFDPVRKVGDTGLVDTQHGAHIMYYTGYVLSWKNQVKQTYIEETYSKFYENMLEQFEVEKVNLDVTK